MAMPLRVLIVEDSEADTQLLLRELRAVGYDPIWERVERRCRFSTPTRRLNTCMATLTE